LHEQLCFFGAEFAVDFKFFPHEALVGNEEILDLVKQMFVEIAEVAGRAVFLGENWDGEKAIVLFHFAAIALPGFQAANQP